MDVKMYWDKQQEISRAVSKLAVEILQAYPELYRHYFRWTRWGRWRERGESSSVRAAMVCLMYEALGGGDWWDAVPMAACAELEIASLYTYNTLLDNKGNGGGAILKPHTDPGMYLLVGSWLRNAAQASFNALVSEGVSTSLAQADLMHEFLYIDAAATAGFLLDRYELTPRILEKPAEVREDLYLKRCHLMNACFFESMCGIAARLAGASEEMIRTALEFGQAYGIGLQIVNDIADFVAPEYKPGTNEKGDNDAWADLKNRRITLPVLIGWENGSDNCKERIKRALIPCVFDTPYRELTETLLEEGHIQAAQRVARGYAKEAHALLRGFPKEKRAHLSCMLVLFETNRYYRALKPPP